ncbi:MAG: thiol peroxidase [Gammaproteobacteria bacterium]
MATVTLKGNTVQTTGELPSVGTRLPDFQLTDANLRDVSLSEWEGKKKLISIFPSIDTPVCALSTKKFNDYARKHADTVMLMVSADLPFAQTRFCKDERLENVHVLSTMRAADFAKNYGVGIVDGPMAGLTARALLVADENNMVLHSELVPDIGNEPDYDAAMKALH